jgi:preprotein translocase subunit SecD
MDPMGVAGGVRLVYRVQAPRRRALPPAPNAAGVVERTADVVRQRIKSYNRRASVNVNGDQIEVLIPDIGGQQPVDVFKRIIERSGRLEFKLVDDGSAYMKTVAVAAYRTPFPGVSVQPESWTDQTNGQSHEDIFLAGERSEQLVAAVEAILRAQPLPEDHQILLEQRASDWRTYYAFSQNHVDNADLRGADVTFSTSGDPEVAVELNPAGSAKLAALTERTLGRKIALVFEDRVVTAPVVIGKIPGPRLRIALGARANPYELQQEAKDLVALLRVQPLPAPVVLVSEAKVAPRR